MKQQDFWSRPLKWGLDLSFRDVILDKHFFFFSFFLLLCFLKWRFFCVALDVLEVTL